MNFKVRKVESYAIGVDDAKLFESYEVLITHPVYDEVAGDARFSHYSTLEANIVETDEIILEVDSVDDLVSLRDTLTAAINELTSE